MKLLPWTIWMLCSPIVCLYCDSILFGWYGKPEGWGLMWLFGIEIVICLAGSSVLWDEAKGEKDD